MNIETILLIVILTFGFGVVLTGGVRGLGAVENEKGAQFCPNARCDAAHCPGL
jgi:hypothetical protein